MRLLLPVLCLLFPLLVLPACRDECDPSADEGVCEGDVARNCPAPGVDQIVGTRWRAEDCSEREQVCVKPEGSFGSFCALSSEPEPLCADEAQRACETEESLLYCHLGFATGQGDCRSCEEGDAGPTCLGGSGSACTSDTECASTYECKTNPSCEDCTELHCFRR